MGFLSYVWGFKLCGIPFCPITAPFARKIRAVLNVNLLTVNSRLSRFRQEPRFCHYSNHPKKDNVSFICVRTTFKRIFSK